MTTQNQHTHTPTTGDMYRTPSGDWYIIANSHGSSVLNVMNVNGDMWSVMQEGINLYEFVGNVKALPELVQFLQRFIVWARTHRRKCTFSEAPKAEALLALAGRKE